LLILTTFLTSCSTVQELDIFTTEVERAPLNLENPATPKMDELKFIIVHSENAEEVFAKMKEQGKDPVVFGLSDDDYETLSKNFAQIRAYIIQQQLIIQQYRDYYEPADDTQSE
jgi:hypothetical protein